MSKFTLNQKVTVKDKKDGKQNPAKIIEVDPTKQEVKIHYIDWHSRHDEVLAIDSSRISLEVDNAESSNSTCYAHTQSVDVGNCNSPLKNQVKR